MIRLGRSLALILLLPVLAFTSHSQAANPAEWVVHDVVHCVNDELVVDQNIRIVSGGRLILEGCALRINSPPYQNQWLNSVNEGLLVTVEQGGRLDLLNSTDRAASVEAQDARYGYRVDVNGTFTSNGRPGLENSIRHLEGFQAEAFIDGGLQVTGPGRAFLNHTAVRDIFGPALFVWGGGFAEANNVSVTGASGAFAVTNGSLAVRDAQLNTGIEVIRVSNAELVMERVQAVTDRTLLAATKSNVMVTDSRLLSSGTALSLVSSNLQLANTTLQYGKFGIIHKPQAVGESTHHLVSIQETRIEAMIPGMQSAGLSLEWANLTLVDSEIANNSVAGLSIGHGALYIANTTFVNSSPSDVFALDATTNLTNNRFSLIERPVVISYLVTLKVVDEHRKPAPGVEIRIDARNGSTDANGTLQVYWNPPLDGNGNPTVLAIPVTAFLNGQAKTLTAHDTTKLLVFDYSPSAASNSISSPFWAAFLAVPLAIAFRRRPSADSPA